MRNRSASIDTVFFVIAGALVLLALFIFAFRKLLDVTKPVDEGQRPSIATAFQSRWALFGAVAIFLYVGAEVSIGSAMTNFLHEPDMLNISLEDAGKMVSFYWGGAMVGRLIGSSLLFIVKQRAPWLLALFALGAATLCLAVSQLHGATAAHLALSIGLFNSIMFPVIFTLDAGAIDRGAGRHLGPAVPRDRGWRDPAVRLRHDRGRGRTCTRHISCRRWRTCSSSYSRVAATRAPTYRARHGDGRGRALSGERLSVMDDKARHRDASQPAFELAV